MTLMQVIKAFEVIASHQPSVNMIVQNDIFRLNACSDARYGVFGWTQGQHTSSADADMMNYSFTFFYIDRLTNDKSNQVEVQSVGIQTLYNIVKAMDGRGIYVDGSFTFQTFNQRFLDECAGAFCNVTVSVPSGSLCPEEFPDFLEADFNDNFFIF